MRLPMPMADGNLSLSCYAGLPWRPRLIASGRIRNATIPPNPVSTLYATTPGCKSYRGRSYRIQTSKRRINIRNWYSYLTRTWTSGFWTALQTCARAPVARLHPAINGYWITQNTSKRQLPPCHSARVDRSSIYEAPGKPELDNTSDSAYQRYSHS